MELAVLNITGKETGRKVDLNDSIFAIDPSDHAIYLDVKQYLNNQRQGTAKAKERAEITGSTRKIKRQKGTGTARAGSIKSPLFRGGGRAFGPQPREYNMKLNKKVKQLARKSALSYKAKNDQIIVLEDFNLENPKTKDFINILENLKIQDKKSLLVLSDSNKNIYLSSRNFQKANVVTVSELSTYKIMNSAIVCIAESSVAKIEQMFGNKE